MGQDKTTETLSFGAGCFWGVEHAFKQLSGVNSTEVGYQGGEVENPTYEQVCGKNTGHVEVVKVEFDPQEISLERLLDAFFFMHDGTQVDRQGPDVGPQYRSVIFPTHDLQEKRVRDYVEKKKESEPDLVTTVEKGKPFYSAEGLHQDYLAHNPGGYCHIGFDIFSKLKQNQF